LNVLCDKDRPYRRILEAQQPWRTTKANFTSWAKLSWMYFWPLKSLERLSIVFTDHYLLFNGASQTLDNNRSIVSTSTARISANCQPSLLWHPSASKWNNLEQWDINASDREPYYFEPSFVTNEATIFVFFLRLPSFLFSVYVPTHVHSMPPLYLCALLRNTSFFIVHNFLN
jgi:hypothetical protein